MLYSWEYIQMEQMAKSSSESGIELKGISSEEQEKSESPSLQEGDSEEDSSGDEEISESQILQEKRKEEKLNRQGMLD